MDKLNPFTVGLATALTLVVINTLCAAAVALWPDGTLAVFNSFTHGLDFRAVKIHGAFWSRPILDGLDQHRRDRVLRRCHLWLVAQPAQPALMGER